MGIGMRERRWIVLTADGGHVTVGRHSDPSPAELEVVANHLRESQIAGWLAVLEGSYYQTSEHLNVMQVRSLSAIDGNWERAVQLFEERRRAT
jgi:hypothetical protein